MDPAAHSMAVLGRAHDAAMEALRNEPIDLGNRLTFEIAGLHLAQIELAGSIDVMFQSERYAGITPTFRNFMEVSVEVENLLSDPSYLDSRELLSWLHILRTLNESAKETPERWGMLSAAMAKDRGDIEQRVARLRSAGITALHTVKERFERAGRSEWYRFVYAMHSADAHGDRLRIARHNFERHPDGHVGLMLYKQQPEIFRGELIMAADILLRSAIRVREHLQLPPLAAFASLLEELGLNARAEETTQQQP